MDAATPSSSDRPLIVALAVETTPHGSINVTDQVLMERSYSGSLRTWNPSELVGGDEVEVVTPSENIRRNLFGEEEDDGERLLEGPLAEALRNDSGSESEDEELTQEELHEILVGHEANEEDPGPEVEDLGEDLLTWSDDFASFRGEREIFQESAGPKIEDREPIDIFTKIWDQPLLETIVRETNEYAWQKISAASETGISTGSRMHKWLETKTPEIYRLISVIILMGICVRGRIDEYWMTGVMGMPDFRKLMSIDRFWLLMGYLHFVDNQSISPACRGYKRKISKIKPLVDYLNEKFIEIYTPAQEISIDESLLLWKGHLSWIQCIRTKAARFGIKSYELCEAITGYCARFHIYAGKSSPSTEALYGFTSATAKTVLKLLQGFFGKGYTLFMDNFYNSIPLTRFLKCKKTDVVGTLNRRRIDTPAEIKSLNEKRVERGNVISRHCGDVSVTAWKDVRLVTTVSTYHNDEMVPGRRAGQTCQKPAVIRDYNKYMGGVDLKDQKLSMYLLERKRGIKWYIKVFRRLLNISILNSYIIYCANIGQRTGKMTHRQFRYRLASQLSERYGVNSQTRSHSSNPCDRLNISLLHFPDHRGVSEEERRSKAQVRYQRGRCVRCLQRNVRTMSNIICRQCNVFLCVGQCWLQYHTEE